MPEKVSEAQLQAQCTDFLALDGWRPLRTDPCSDRARGKGFGEKGMADHLYLRYEVEGQQLPNIFGGDGQIMWIEWKRLKGKSATKSAVHQKQWHMAERARGALVLVAGEDFPATWDGFLHWYRRSGLLRREGL